LCQLKPIHIQIGSSNISINERIEQNFEVLEDKQKEQRLKRHLEKLGSK